MPALSFADVTPGEVLAGTELFRDLPEAAIEKLLPSVRSRRYARDEHLFREGDPASHLYVVTSGQVKIAKSGRDGEEMVFAVVGPGKVFAELPLFEAEGERSADAQALEPSECLVIARAAFLDFCHSHPEVLVRIINALGGYIRRKDQAMAEVTYLDIPGRVASKLLELAAANGQEVADGVLITLPLTQRTLAGMVGASRENVNRALHVFTELGYIRHARGEITVLKLEELRRRA